MNLPTVRVTAPSRLHFGMLSFGNDGVPQYGGVGIMVDVPVLQLRISPSWGRAWEFCGPLAERIEEFASRWIRTNGLKAVPACRIEVQQLPPPHTGLGTGTQLALSVAAGLHKVFGLDMPTPCQLARSVGRAARSAVGTFGFFHGGFIFESGKNSPDGDAILEQQLPICDAWRVVLIRPVAEVGISGQTENDTFSQLPPVPTDVTTLLRSEVVTRMSPAVASGDFGVFSESVYAYGRIAGDCFASAQGGTYAAPELSRIVTMLRGWGIRGVGQSSWGPTLFALVSSQEAANQMVQQLQAEVEDGAYELVISRPNNSGATFLVTPGAGEKPNG